MIDHDKAKLTQEELNKKKENAKQGKCYRQKGKYNNRGKHLGWYKNKNKDKLEQQIEETYYYNDVSSDLSQVMMTYDDTGMFDTAYTYGVERIGIDILDGTRPDAQKPLYYLYDGQGSVTYVTKPDGEKRDTLTYYEFGKPRTGKLSPDGDKILHTSFGYNGEQWDEETKLQYLRARYYEPETGRFLSRDTYEGELENPLSKHLYAYVQNNPLRYNDPSGHWTSDVGNAPIEDRILTSDHAFITFHAMRLFRKTQKISKNFENLWKKYSYAIINGSDQADNFPWKTGNIYYNESHFWSPETNASYSGSKKYTAVNEVVAWFNASVSNYKYNPYKAFYDLGFAAHFIEDLGQPYHASNIHALNSDHVSYETWATKQRNLAIKGGDKNNQISSYIATSLTYTNKDIKSFAEMVGTETFNYAKNLGWTTDVKRTSEGGFVGYTLKRDLGALQYQFRQSQRSTAKLFYLFYQKVKNL